MSLKKICAILAAVSCLNSGQSFTQIARSAGKSSTTIRRWVNRSGFTRNKVTGLYSQNH